MIQPFQTQTVGDFGSKNQNCTSKNSDSTDSTDSTDSRSRSLSPPRSEFRYSVQVWDPQEPQDPQAPTFAKAGAMSGFKKSMFQIGWSEHGAYPKMAISKGWSTIEFWGIKFSGKICCFGICWFPCLHQAECNGTSLQNCMCSVTQTALRRKSYVLIDKSTLSMAMFNS